MTVLPLAVLLAATAIPSKAADFYFSFTRGPQSLSDAPTNVDVIPSSSWENSSARTVADVIENEPGVIVRKSASMGSSTFASIRGFSSQQILVVIDDVPQTPDLTGTVDLSRIPLDNVDRIEILRGGASAVYGPNAEGGVIHILTKAPKKSVDAEFSSMAGSFATYSNRLLLGTQTGPVQMQVTASRDLSSGFQQNSFYHNTNLTGLLAYDADGWGKLAYYSTGADGKLGLPSGTPVPIGEWNGTVERQANDTVANQSEMDRNSRLQYDNRFGVVDFTARIADNLTNRNVFEFGSNTNIRTEGRNAYAKGEIPAIGAVGYEFYQRRLDSDVYGVNRDNAWGTFIEIYALSNDVVKLIPGGRYDRDNTYGESWSPRVQLIVKPNPYLKLSASANRSFQAPTFADLFDPFVPPPFPQTVQLNPEITWSYDAGVTAIPAKGMEATTTLFRADTRDRIALDPNRGFAAFNLDRAYSEGIESSVSYDCWRLKQRLSYTYLEARGEDNGSNYEWLQFTPKHSIQYRADLRLPEDIVLTNTLRYLHRQWTGFGETGVQIPGYVTDDLRLSMKTQWLDAFVEVSNLLDRHYAETADAFNGYFPQPGRAYYGGITLKFLKS